MTLTMENEPPRNNTSLEQLKSYVAALQCSKEVINTVFEACVFIPTTVASFVQCVIIASRL